MKMATKIVQIHIPRTAGTAVRGAFARALGGNRIHLAGPHAKFGEVDHNLYDVFSGHFGYNRATQIEGDLVTVLRDPVDRLLSYYYTLRRFYAAQSEVSHRTKLAHTYKLCDFVHLCDDPHLIEDLFNTITWQIAFGSTQQERMELKSSGHFSDDTLIHMAMDNLTRFRLVGFQGNIDLFVQKIAKLYAIDFTVVHENVTAERPGAAEIDVRTIRKIHEWLYLDLEFYRRAQKEFGSG
jgi:hypothetical protein